MARPRSRRARSRRTHAVPARARRFRVSVLQPHSKPHRARERGAGDRDRRHPLEPRQALALVGLDSGAITSPRSCRAANSSASRSRAPSSNRPRSSSATSPPVRWNAPGQLVLDVIERVNEHRHDDRDHHPQRADRADGGSRAAPWRRTHRRRRAESAKAFPRGDALVRPLDRKLLRDIGPPCGAR